MKVVYMVYLNGVIFEALEQIGKIGYDSYQMTPRLLNLYLAIPTGAGFNLASNMVLWERFNGKPFLMR